MSDNAAQYGLSNVEKLSVLCLDAIALDLAGTIALDIGKQNLLQLRNHFCLTREISEGMLFHSYNIFYFGYRAVDW